MASTVSTSRNASIDVMRAAAAMMPAARARSPDLVSGTGGTFVMGLSPV